MNFQGTRLLALSATSFLLAVSAAAQTSTPTPTPPISFTRNYNFPPIGLAGTETLQVNVVNTAAAPGTGSTSSTAAVACKGTVTFANASGAAIGSPVAFAVGPGVIFSAPLPFSKTSYSSRGEVLASVQQTVALTQGSAQCSLLFSLETFDTNTGVTHAFVTSASPGAAPIPVLPGIFEALP